jgi:hypothetical protein
MNQCIILNTLILKAKGEFDTPVAYENNVSYTDRTKYMPSSWFYSDYQNELQQLETFNDGTPVPPLSFSHMNSLRRGNILLSPFK